MSWDDRIEEQKRLKEDAAPGVRELAEAMSMAAGVWGAVLSIATTFHPGEAGLPGGFIDAGDPIGYDYDKRAGYIIGHGYTRALAKYAVVLRGAGGRLIALGRQLEVASQKIQRVLARSGDGR